MSTVRDEQRLYCPMQWWLTSTLCHTAVYRSTLDMSTSQIVTTKTLVGHKLVQEAEIVYTFRTHFGGRFKVLPHQSWKWLVGKDDGDSIVARLKSELHYAMRNQMSSSTPARDQRRNKSSKAPLDGLYFIQKVHPTAGRSPATRDSLTRARWRLSSPGT